MKKDVLIKSLLIFLSFTVLNSCFIYNKGVGVLESALDFNTAFNCTQDVSEEETPADTNEDKYSWHDCKTCKELGYTVYDNSSDTWKANEAGNISGENGSWPEYSQNTQNPKITYDGVEYDAAYLFDFNMPIYGNSSYSIFGSAVGNGGSLIFYIGTSIFGVGGFPISEAYVNNQSEITYVCGYDGTNNGYSHNNAGNLIITEYIPNSSLKGSFNVSVAINGITHTWSGNFSIIPTN